MADELWRRLLGEVWAGLDRAGLDREAADGPAWTGGLELTGEPGQLPSRLPVEDVAIACAGAALLAAAALHAGRGGQRVAGPPAGPAGTWRRPSGARPWLRVNGEPGRGRVRAAVTVLAGPADGWVRTHANYPWHREALLRALALRRGSRRRWRRPSPAWARPRSRTW